MRTYAQPLADERTSYPPPIGYHFEWIEPDPEFERLAEDDELGRKCRRQGCQWPVAWALLRSNGWWLYCAEHNYGRKIENGKLLSRRVVPNTETGQRGE